jgi:L-iditol 2-dehydrogenase
MKAAVLRAKGDIRYEEAEEPQIRPGCVKIRVRASGVCGSDIPRVLGDEAHFFPIILGHEFSGDAVEIGEGVRSIALGDRVSVAPLIPCFSCPDCLNGDYALCKRYSFIGSREQGGFAEHVVVPAANVVVFDSLIPYEYGAMFEPASVALHGLLLNKQQKGGSVAILGAGTIGVFVLQWAKIYGAEKIAVFDVDEGRLEMARKLGADAAVNASSCGFSEAALELADGRGFDYVYETSGASQTMLATFDIAANKASICFIGTPKADLAISPSRWERINRKEFTMTGSWMSYSAPFPGQEWRLVATCLADGRLKFDPSMIFAKFPLSECAKAFDLFRTPGKVHGKVMFALE